MNENKKYVHPKLGLASVPGNYSTRSVTNVEMVLDIDAQQGGVVTRLEKKLLKEYVEK